MLLIVKQDSNIIDKLTKLLGYTPVYYTFEEKFLEFKKNLSKKDKRLATEEIFSLYYDSLLSDLKKSIWVSIDKDELSNIKDKIKILEIC